MTQYYRPIVQTDAARPAGAVPLAGHPDLWFSTVERITRCAPSELMAVADIPAEMLHRLCAARADVAGLDMTAPTIMGVLNTTPDSFSDGGQFDAAKDAMARAQAMIHEGAGLLDIGGESTRPGAALVDIDTEIARTEPVIRALRGAGVSVPISIDTRKAEVARAALRAGATLINDVSALSFDGDMAQVVADADAPICLMHAQGDPKTMQHAPRYDTVLLDVYDHLAQRIAQAQAAGIKPERIIIDPGIGFGKTQAHNLTLIQNLSLFHGLGCPILLGVSRKGFIGKIGNQPDAGKRGPGSLALALNGLMQGVQIVRTHDIEVHAQGFALWRSVNS